MLRYQFSPPVKPVRSNASTYTCKLLLGQPLGPFRVRALLLRPLRRPLARGGQRAPHVAARAPRRPRPAAGTTRCRSPRRGCARMIGIGAAGARGTNGTLSPATARTRSGWIQASCQTRNAPQSWPTKTALSSPIASSSAAHVPAQREHVVGLDVRRRRAVAVAAHVRREHSVAGPGESGDLMAPGEGQLGEAVAEHDRAGPRPPRARSARCPRPPAPACPGRGRPGSYRPLPPGPVGLAQPALEDLARVLARQRRRSNSTTRGRLVGRRGLARTCVAHVVRARAARRRSSSTYAASASPNSSSGIPNTAQSRTPSSDSRQASISAG